MEITNEKKAREICGCSNCYHNLKGSECLKDNGILCCLKPCLKDTLQAMRWKDAEHAKERQQWIDKACQAFCKQHCGDGHCQIKGQCPMLFEFEQLLECEK